MDRETCDQFDLQPSQKFDRSLIYVGLPISQNRQSAGELSVEGKCRREKIEKPNDVQQPEEPRTMPVP